MVETPEQIAANQIWKTQNGSDYKIGTMEYPAGLRTQPDLQNYVAFYINTRDKATGGKGNPKNVDYYISDAEQRKADIQNNLGPKFNQNDIGKAGKFLADNAGKGTTFAIGLGGVLMGVKVKDLPVLAGTALTAGAVVGGVGIPGTEYKIPGLVDVINNQNYSLFKSGKTSRLKDIITLHISEKPVVSYGVNYTNRDIGVLAGILVQGSATATGVLGAAGNPEFQSRGLAELAKIPQLKSAGGTLTDIIELNGRQKSNPFRETLFESVDYRTFQFSYRFLPKTEDETKRIEAIINTFKKHMHPQITQNKLFYIYPSEFDIKYFYKNDENKHLHKFARCALTDMVVDYGGDQFVTIGYDGAPAEIGMTLKFQELEQMTSEGVGRGY
jgi:hypothetical protein